MKTKRIAAIQGIKAYYLPLKLRVPLKFGGQTIEEAEAYRVEVTVSDGDGRTVHGWGETPLSLGWVWPGELPYETRGRHLHHLIERICDALVRFEASGHALEVGYDFQRAELPDLLKQLNDPLPEKERIPWLAALLGFSSIDLALHDAFGKIAGAPVYKTYTGEYLNRDLAYYLDPETGSETTFAGKYPEAFLQKAPPTQLIAWHLVGGMDALTAADLTGAEPDDGFPVTLDEWIRRDGLQCLKIKLSGKDLSGDFDRLLRVAEVSSPLGVRQLSADFNCAVEEPDYVCEILDRLQADHPTVFSRILYVEQPFPYDLKAHLIDVHEVSARKPLFMDESAHDWEYVRLGSELGWTGVALKTCKTQTGALLSACWAKANGIATMVQDLTNPMIAQVSHVQLAAHVGTILGVETNAMQYYPEASLPEAVVHPGLYRRREGRIDLSSIKGSGFGYRIDAIERNLPPPETIAEA